MLPEPPSNPTDMSSPGRIDPLDLFSLCSRDTSNSALWTEFLRRYTGRIKIFIRRCLIQWGGNPGARSPIGETQESDLFQNVIVRLVKNDCAAMKQFSGESEDDLLAYLAVITRSVVRDCQRGRAAMKRASDRADLQVVLATELQNLSSTGYSDFRAIERRLLAREVAELSERTLKVLPGPYSVRDRLIFQLYFQHNLSTEQITRCKGIALSKAGVEKVLNRLKERIRAATASSRPPAEVEL